MKRIMLVALLAVSSAAFAGKPKAVPPSDAALRAADQKMVAAAQDVIRDSLKDPESARFRGVFISPKGRAVCGDVNAKNSMGGYVGFRRFIVARDRRGIEDDETYFAESNWVARCIDDRLEGDPVS